MALNRTHPKVVYLTQITGYSFADLDRLHDLEDNPYSLMAHECIRALDLPAEEVFLDALKGGDINSLDDVIRVVKWHLNRGNIAAHLKQ